jgi:hypothetical protein
VGINGSGKSTLKKQLNRRAFSTSELKQWTLLLQNNVVSAVQAMLEETTNADVAGLRAEIDAGNTLTAAHVDQIQQMWRAADHTASHSRFRPLDNHGYCLQHAERMLHAEFVPTFEDILHASARTTGVVQSMLCVAGSQIEINDLGGTRNERRKWIHCFNRSLPARQATHLPKMATLTLVWVM